MYILGYNLQQEHMYTPNNGHDRFTPIPCHAETFYLQGSCLHPCVLCHLQTVFGGAEAHLGGTEF